MQSRGLRTGINSENRSLNCKLLHTALQIHASQRDNHLPPLLFYIYFHHQAYTEIQLQAFQQILRDSQTSVEISWVSHHLCTSPYA